MVWILGVGAGEGEDMLFTSQKPPRVPCITLYHNQCLFTIPYHKESSHHSPSLATKFAWHTNNQIHFTYCRCFTYALFPVKPLVDNQTLPAALGWVLSIVSLVYIPTWTSSFYSCVVLCMGGALSYCSWLLPFLPLLSCLIDFFFIDFFGKLRAGTHAPLVQHNHRLFLLVCPSGLSGSVALCVFLP